MSNFADFLKRNSILPLAHMPLVHTLSGYDLTDKIIPSDAIDPPECDVFSGENLNYFFVGRPAYKTENSDAVAAEWELPCCFIFEYHLIRNVKRVFPFDSGAHDGQRYPQYIQMMDMNKFEVAQISDAPHRILGAYFRSTQDYFDLRPKEEEAFKSEFSISPMDAEIMAIHRLAGDNREAGNYDDRRFAIEVQSGERVDLKVTKPLAVVLPHTYADLQEVRETIENRWGAEVISYPIFSLSIANYYATIYSKVLEYYETEGLIS